MLEHSKSTFSVHDLMLKEPFTQKMKNLCDLGVVTSKHQELMCEELQEFID